MSLILRPIVEAEIEEILAFENKKLAEQIPDETDRALQSWNARWRKESLAHFVPMGWSFLAREPSQRSDRFPEGQLVGYFIAQPLLFFDGQTQSLWVEHIQFNSLKTRDDLCELAHKLSKDKHFQRVYFPKNQSIMNSIRQLGADDWIPTVAFTKTTKVSS